MLVCSLSFFAGRTTEGKGQVTPRRSDIPGPKVNDSPWKAWEDLYEEFKDLSVRKVVGNTLPFPSFSNLYMFGAPKAQPDDYMYRIHGISPFDSLIEAQRAKSLFEKVRPKLDIPKTSQCPPLCKIGKALSDHVNILADVDDMIARNEPQAVIIEYLANKGYLGISEVNITRHKQHLLVQIQPKDTERFTKKDPTQAKVTNPDYVQVLIPRALIDKTKKIMPAELVSESIQILMDELQRLQAIPPDEAVEIPKYHDRKRAYLAELRLWTTLAASMKEATGESIVDWEAFNKRMAESKETKPKDKDEGDKQA